MEIPQKDEPAKPGPDATPEDIREYIEDMASQLARMALAQGDFSLASALHAASTAARKAGP